MSLPPHALVTGAGRGIGAAIARALAGDGWRVTLAGRSVEALEAVRATLPAPAGGVHAVVRLDVADGAGIADAFADARARQGRLHALVNNAGAVETAPAQRVQHPSWQRMLDVNLTGVFLCCQAALADLRQEPAGRIVNIASTAALKGYPHAAAYAAAKHGVVGLTRSLALELATAGVPVNAVCPGYTDTDMIRDGIARIVARKGSSAEDALRGFTQANPMRRLVRPEEVAEVVRWLCRQAPAPLTGQSLSVSGGETT